MFSAPNTVKNQTMKESDTWATRPFWKKLFGHGTISLVIGALDTTIKPANNPANASAKVARNVHSHRKLWRSS